MDNINLSPVNSNASMITVDDEMVDALATTPLEQTHLSDNRTSNSNNSSGSSSNSNNSSSSSNNSSSNSDQQQHHSQQTNSPDQYQSPSESQLTLRRKILAIHSNPSLSQADKARRMQELMCAQHQLSRQQSTGNQSRPQSPTATHSRQGSITSAQRLITEAAQALSSVVQHRQHQHQHQHQHQLQQGTAVASESLAAVVATQQEYCDNHHMADNNIHGDTEGVGKNEYDNNCNVENGEILHSITSIDGQVFRLTARESIKSFRDMEQSVLGCEHYARGCKVQASCCHRWFCCRFCHDQESNHEMNRHASTNMLCMYCQTIQPTAQHCGQCKRQLGRYYCDQCNLWDNDPQKSIYHCQQCGICRLGRGLDDDYFHCDKCGVCMAINLRGNHRCIERNLDSDCPICGEYMFTSTSTVIFMKCGHSIHWSCHQDHIKNSYQCPICWKSLADMSSYFQQIDRMLEQHKMPPEYEDVWSIVLCNDCEQKSKTKYHFLYHKCQNCQSYNTKIVSTVQERSGGQDGGGGNGDGDEEGGVDGAEVTLHLQTLGDNRPRSSSAVSAESRHTIFFDDNENRSRPH